METSSIRETIYTFPISLKQEELEKMFYNLGNSMNAEIEYHGRFFANVGIDHEGFSTRSKDIELTTGTIRDNQSRNSIDFTFQRILRTNLYSGIEFSLIPGMRVEELRTSCSANTDLMDSFKQSISQYFSMNPQPELRLEHTKV